VRRRELDTCTQSEPPTGSGVARSVKRCPYCEHPIDDRVDTKKICQRHQRDARPKDGDHTTSNGRQREVTAATSFPRAWLKEAMLQALRAVQIQHARTLCSAPEECDSNFRWEAARIFIGQRFDSFFPAASLLFDCLKCSSHATLWSHRS
jgi:hypothetical protein